MAKKTTTGSTTGNAPPKTPARATAATPQKSHTAAAPAQQVKQGSQANNELVNLSYEMIAERAYQIWKSQGGSDFENWIRAERELRSSANTAN